MQQHQTTIAALALLITAACFERSEFVCAERYGTSETDIRRCDAPHERCVCYTQRCAKPVAKATCPTGYQYSKRPIGSGECVLDADLPLKTAGDFADEETGVCVEPDVDAGAGSTGGGR